MKTLKKTLCLVLAVVMVLGLGVMSASAKLDNYADENAITYREAVDVMSGIGVLEGDAGGFRPTDSVKRSEAAKIIAYLLVGNEKQADALKATVDPFTDVPATHWAAGYIAYCANAGIITGMGDGTFAPDAQVTGLQFAKMLLSAIGYNANDEYSGSEWAINVSKDALRLGVFDDNLAGATNAPATREECALYAFNTAAKSRNVSDGQGGTYKQYGLAKVSYSALLGGYITTGVLSGNDSPDANMAATIAGDYKLKSEDREDDAFKRDTGHYWYIDDARKTVITADYDKDGNLKATYTTGVTGDDIYQLLGKDANDDDTTLTLWVNGTKVTDDPDDAADGKTAIDTSNFKKGYGDTLKHTGNGVQTYVYAKYIQGDLDIKICVIDTYLAKVTDVKASTSKKDPSTEVEVLDGWDADNTVADPRTQPAGGFNTEEFEEDDYVLITMTTDRKIQSMEAVKTVEDEVSRYNKTGKKITVTSGGTDYVAAKNTATNADLKAADDDSTVNKGIVNGKEHTLYVDNYGYLIAVAEVEATSNYVYAAHFGRKTDTSGDFDGNDVAVKLYYADGTSKVVTLNTKAGNGGDSDFIGDSIDPDVLNTTETGIYKVTMKSGKAVLSSDGIETVSGNVKKGFSSSVGATKNANSKTVFFYVKYDTEHSGYYAWNDDDNFKVTVYTGINSVPANKDGDKAAADTAIIKGDNAAAVLVKDTLTGESTDTVYFFTGDYNVDRSDWTVTYETYVNGQLEPVKISYKDEETKNTEVAKFVGDPDDPTDYGYINKFFTLNDKNEPVTTKITEADGSPNVVSKTKYDDELTLTSVDDFELVATATAADGTYAIDGMKVIDLTGNDDVIGNAKTLKKSLEDNDIIISVQYTEAGTITYLYVVDVTAK